VTRLRNWWATQVRRSPVLRYLGYTGGVHEPRAAFTLIEDARKLFSAARGSSPVPAAIAAELLLSPPCPYCGGYHVGMVCPRCKSVDYGPSGNVIHVEFWPDPDWRRAARGRVIFADELPAPREQPKPVQEARA
jgi:hypothetical protein